MITGTCSVTM